ncbi:hypothetical protein ABXV23_19055 [Vibrio owensii]|uniref:hypothetical protein n=1 Tax=Vibrio owensii TaxID=696485 RepID=UPI0018F22259|nr:hypothetical protein [Vibrio owensii]
MKKLVLAAIVSSVAVGANAAPKFHAPVNFGALTDTSSKTITIEGVIPERCLLRIGYGGSGAFAQIDKLYQASMSSSDHKVAPNPKIQVANLRAWCNHNDGLNVKVEASGLENSDGDVIHYRVFVDNEKIFNTKNASMGDKYIDWTGIHMTNEIKKIPVHVRPQRSGFARSGTYSDDMTVTLTASVAPAAP